MCCFRGHSLLNVPLRSGCRGGPGYPAPASISRLGARHQSCGGGYCEPEKEPQPQLHEPRSGVGAPGQEDRRLWLQKGAGAGHSGPRPPAVGVRGRQLARCVPAPARSWLRRSQTSEPAAHPCAGLAGCGLQLFWLPHPPLRLPAPRRGWSCSAGPLNPGRTEGRLAGEGGAGPESSSLRRTQHSGAGEARWPGAVGWGVGWGGSRDSCREATRASARARTHTHSQARTHTHTQALTPPLAALLPQDRQPPPPEQ